MPGLPQHKVIRKRIPKAPGNEYVGTGSNLLSLPYVESLGELKDSRFVKVSVGEARASPLEAPCDGHWRGQQVLGSVP